MNIHMLSFTLLLVEEQNNSLVAEVQMKIAGDEKCQLAIKLC